MKTYSFNQHYISYNINYKYYFMKEDIPEKSVERLHLKYDEYKATAEEPIFTFKEFCSKMQYLETLVEEIDYYKKEKSKLESEIEVLKKELNFDSKITDVEVDKLIMDFNNFYDEVIDSSLRYDEKFKKLELYYLNVVRNIDNEFKLLHSIQNRINEELKTDGVNSLLIEIHDISNIFYF